MTCQAGGPYWGYAYIYSEKSFGGNCAAAVVTENLGWGYGLHAPWVFLELNGWQNITAHISPRSLKLGGSAAWGFYTAIVLSSGPDAAVTPDPWLHCGISNWQSTSADYPDILATCGVGSIDSFYMFAQ